MMFGLGCCCGGSGGIYDFWAIGGAYSELDTTLDNRTILSRMPSNQIIITGYFSNSSQIGNQASSRQDANITSYLAGAYIDCWNSGETLRQSSKSLYPISMNLVGSERIWHAHDIAPTGSDKDYFSHSGINGATGIRTIGSGVSVSGSSLVVLSDAPTTGAFVRWAFPESNLLADNWDFDISSTYDKTLLIISTINGGKQYRQETWFAPTGSFSNNKYILYNSGAPINTGTLSTFFDRSKYLESIGAGNYNIYCTEHAETDAGDSTIYLGSLEFRLVDQITGYTLDDVSGFTVDLKNLRMPFTRGSDEPGEDADWRIGGTGHLRLAFLDPIGKNTIYSKILTYADDYYTGLTGIDVYRYRQNELPTGSARKSQSFNLSNFQEATLGHYTTVSINSHYDIATGSRVVGRLLNNHLLSSWTDSSDEINHLAFTSDGNGILAYQSTVHNFDRSHTYTTNESIEIRDGYSALNPISDLGPWSAWTLDARNQGTPASLTTRLHTLFKSIDTTGGDSFMYGSHELHWLAEQEVPITEKESLYQRILYDIGHTGGPLLFTNFNALDINNYNIDSGYAKLCVFANRDAPNAFSVKLPKENYIHGTGTLNGTISDYPTGLLSQTVKILYGRPLQDNVVIRAISGQHMSGLTGVGMRMDFTGHGGQVKNHSATFTYDSIIYRPSGGGLVPSGFVSTGGEVYDFTYSMVYGDPSGEVLWEDTFEQLVPYTRFYNPESVPRYTGIYRSPQILNVSAIVTNGCTHLPTSSKAFCFIHSRNHYKTGILPTATTGFSGEAYCKIKIGNNIVFNTGMYNELPVRGPYAIHTTESDQIARMSGNYASFVWFEKLWTEKPTHTGNGSQTGWLMHVANHTGMDLWTLRLSGHRTMQYSTNPYVVDSSDRFFYVNDLFMPYPNVASHAEFTTRTQSALDDTGGVRNPRYFVVHHAADWSGAGRSWGFSHDGSAVIPGGWQANDSAGYVPSGFVQDFPSGHLLTETFTTLFGHTVKNSQALSLAPRREDWTGQFPSTGLYYIITGFDTFFTGDETPHMYVSRTGFNLNQYPGYSYLYSGIPFIDYFDDESATIIPHYTYSGTVQSGWF